MLPLASGSSRASDDVLRGTPDLRILPAVAPEPMHGREIARRREPLSLDALRVGRGPLNPAPPRPEEMGWSDSERNATAQNRRARFAELTPVGRRALGVEAERRHRDVEMVDLILRTT